MEIFNSREIASIIWIAIFFSIAYLYPSIKKPFREFLHVVFIKQFIIIYFLVILYISLWVWVLYKIGFWDMSILKSTIFWLLLVSTSTLFRIKQVAENKNYFRKAVLENLKLTLILEFIVGLYTFSFWIEFVIIPIGLFVGIILAASEGNKKSQNVISLFRNFILLAGSLMSLYALYQVFSHYNDHLKMSALKELLVSPILSILFLPFLYFLYLYMNYERVFIGMHNIIKSKELKSYTNKQALLKFNFDINGLNRWRSRLFLKEITSRTDVNASIEEIKSLQRIEKHPPKISAELGWSPYEAKEFLKENGIETDYYSRVNKNDWFACSPSIKLDNEILSNNISYYVNGNQFAAQSLKLVLNMFSPFNARDTHLIFLKYAKSLYKNALGAAMPFHMEKVILDNAEGIFNETMAEISIHKQDWLNKTDGYSINFEIKHKSLF